MYIHAFLFFLSAVGMATVTGVFGSSSHEKIISVDYICHSDNTELVFEASSVGWDIQYHDNSDDNNGFYLFRPYNSELGPVDFGLNRLNGHDFPETCYEALFYVENAEYVEVGFSAYMGTCPATMENNEFSIWTEKDTEHCGLNHDPYKITASYINGTLNLRSEENIISLLEYIKFYNAPLYEDARFSEKEFRVNLRLAAHTRSLNNSGFNTVEGQTRQNFEYTFKIPRNDNTVQFEPSPDNINSSSYEWIRSSEIRDQMVLSAVSSNKQMQGIREWLIGILALLLGVFATLFLEAYKKYRFKK